METQIKGQFAPPITVGDSSALLFQAGGSKSWLWRIFPAQPERSGQTVLPISIETWPRIGYSKNYPAQYASITTHSGTWLVGPSIHLIRPDGRIVSGKLNTPRDAVKVVALPDGVMVLGGYAANVRDFSVNLKVDRVWLDDKGAIQSEALPPMPVKLSAPGSSWGSFESFSALHLGGGQVLVTGGNEYLGRKTTLLYEPTTKNWRILSDMHMPRGSPALIRLPDGRIWATGGTGRLFSERGRDLSVSTTSEFWDPKERVWQRGPDLPVPMQGHQAIWVAEEGTVLLGAGRFPVLLAWKPGDKTVHIAAQMSIERRGGALVPLPGRRVGVVSGIHARVYDEGWGRRSPGSSVVTWTAASASPRSGTWQITGDGGLAVRGNRLLAAGGTLMHTHDGRVSQEATRLAELWEGASDQTISLPPLPFDSRRAEVAWVDEQRALMHASGQLALLDLKTWNYRLLDATPLKRDGHFGRDDHSRLVGADSQRAWLISESASVFWLDVNSGGIAEGPRLQRKRQNFAGRVLADGRVIVAGGTVEGEIVARRPSDCADCPVSYIGWGPYLPARRHDIYDPARKAWRSSAPSRAVGGNSVAILASGQVVKVGLLPSARAPDPNYGPVYRVELEISSPDGSTWRALPFPEGKSPDETHGELPDVRLLAPLGKGGPYPEALFLGVWEYGNRNTGGQWRWWWLPSANAPDPVWREVGTAVAPYVFPAAKIPLEAENGPAWAVGSNAGVMVYGKE
jgi:hypothetical protein